MIGHENSLKEEILTKYTPDALRLLRYLSWFEAKRGQSVSNIYRGEPGSETIPFPTYEPTLLAFVKEAKNSTFLDRNYPYIFTRNHIKSPADSRNMIESAKLTDIDILRGILSKYVIEGSHRSSCWIEAVNEDIFLLILKKFEKFFT